MKAGTTVEAYGKKWIVLDPEFQSNDGTGILCLAADIWEKRAFDENNNNDYRNSSIALRLENLSKELREQGAIFMRYDLDMTADDGTGWDKAPYEADGLFLLTEDLYQKYCRYIDEKEGWKCLATAYSFKSIYGYSHYVRYVGKEGSLSSYSACYEDYGVAPACVFSSIPEQKSQISNIELRENELYQEIELLYDGVKIGEAEVEIKGKMLSKLTIFKPYQNKGYGQKIVELMKEKYGCDNLWVNANNERAIYLCL